MFVVTQKTSYKNNLVYLGFIWQGCCVQHFLDIICVCLLRTACLKAVKGRVGCVLPFLVIR